MARERRHKPKTKRRRRRFSRLYQFMSILLVAAALAAACVVFFRVNRVLVEGNARYTEVEVIEVSQIQTGDNLIALPKGQIANRILVGLPYVQSVSIDRLFPDGVLLTVREHLAAAAVSDGQNWWYLSSRGKLLEQNGEPGPLRITGLTAMEPAAGEKLAVGEGEEARLSYVLELVEVLETRGLLADCSALDCSVTGRLSLSYRNFTVKMPTTGDFDYMLHSLEAALEQDGRVGPDDSVSFDFTVSEGKIYFRRASE